MNVLLVEDEHDFQKVLAEYLTLSGFEVFNKEHIDICILDVMMQVMDGLKIVTETEEHQITIREAELLRYFINNINQVVSREKILNEVWGKNDYFMGRSMDVFISRIRKYLQNEKSIELETIRGVGFILREEAE